MALLANGVCFGQPFAKLRVHITGCRQPECVDMISRRNGLNLAEARMLEAPRKHDMTVEPICPWCDLSKRHPHLERNSSLFWKDSYRPQCANCSNYLVEQGPNLRTLPAEVVFEIVPAARV